MRHTPAYGVFWDTPKSPYAGVWRVLGYAHIAIRGRMAMWRPRLSRVRRDTAVELAAPQRPADRSVLSSGSELSVLSARAQLSVLSAGSILSIGSSGSILSIGSTGSILSVGSAGSILSVGSVGSILSAGSAFSILSLRSAFSILGRRQAFTIGRRGRGRRADDQPPNGRVVHLVTLATVARAVTALRSAARGRRPR